VVQIDASGICHSDVSVLTGDLPGALPVVLGHEGAGTVVEIGPDVTAVRQGDRVVLSAVPACGMCYFCARAEPFRCARQNQIRGEGFTDGTTRIRGASGLGTFSDAIVVPERAVIPVSTDLPSEQLALIGCAILTGVGSALNLATIAPGDSVLVIGAGGIGLAAIQGARLQGALPIVAFDPIDQSRAKALSCGATHAIDPTDEGVGETIRDLTAGIGVDTVIDCVGSAASLDQAWALSRLGGTIVVIGIPGPDVRMNVPLAHIPLSGKTVIGCQYGGSSVFRDVPRYVALAEAGRLDFGALVGTRVGIAEVPSLLAHPLGSGRTIIIP
jgi:S-(hydroxymethyl)glutathione dehydrogenase/alcohol dehydrogenase